MEGIDSWVVVREAAGIVVVSSLLPTAVIVVISTEINKKH